MNNEETINEILGLEDEISSVLDGEDYSIAMSAMALALTRVFYIIEHVRPELTIDIQYKTFIESLNDGLHKFKAVFIFKDSMKENENGGK